MPLRRASGESYYNRIQKGLDVIRANLPNKDSQITSLVFGDLHLEHIRSWRDKNFGNFDYSLEYPLWKAEYEDLLKDLENSKVPCHVTASSNEEEVQVGSLFRRDLYEKAIRARIDGFGERGEFHSIAKVWEVESQIALGL